jgi:hypothetical protein
MTLAEATVRAAARGLAADAAAARVVAALAERRIPSLLLKGPAVARWLYAEDEVRAYGDVDLLVPPSDRDGAEQALRELGFAPLVEEAELRGHRPLHATEWVARDGISVDLHVTISGAGAPPQRVWDALRLHTVPLELGEAETDVLDAAGIALLVALHAAHHGVGYERFRMELRRALDRLPEQSWAEAAALAEGIDATPAFAAGLALDPRGAELAATLGLAGRRTVDATLRASGPPPLALGLEWLSRTPGLRAKARLVVRTTFPAPGAMRAWRPYARRGRVSLAAAYATHPFWLARHLPSSALALRRTRKELR